MKRLFLFTLGVFVAGGIGLTGCRSGHDAATAAGDSAPQAGESVSLYQKRLLSVIDDMNAFEAMAAVAPETDQPEVERQFHNLVNRFKSIIADNPREVEVRLIYAKLLDRFGDREGMLEQCAEVLSVDLSVAVAHQMAGTYFAEEGDYAKALAYYLNALGLAPDEPVYHYGLGDLLYTFRPGFLSDGVFDGPTLDAKMLDAFRRAAELAPDDLRYQFRYGEAFYDLADPDWTVALAHWEALDQRSDLSPLQHDAVHLHEARCLGELKRYDEARTRAESVASEGLTASRQALLDAIDEAAARP